MVALGRQAMLTRGLLGLWKGLLARRQYACTLTCFSPTLSLSIYRAD